MAVPWDALRSCSGARAQIVLSVRTHASYPALPCSANKQTVMSLPSNNRNTHLGDVEEPQHVGHSRVLGVECSARERGVSAAVRDHEGLNAHVRAKDDLRGSKQSDIRGCHFNQYFEGRQRRGRDVIPPRSLLREFSREKKRSEALRAEEHASRRMNVILYTGS